MTDVVGRLSGVALECRDPAALAAFYGALTGMPVVYTSDDWCSIGTAAGAELHLSFQRAPGHVPPVWPDPVSSMQAHLHFRFTDLDAAERLVVRLGAVRAGEHVYLDPAGHPFCLCRAPRSGAGGPRLDADDHVDR